MRLMSFALTTEQMLARTKTVTRRLGWRSLKPGTLLQAVDKAMGLGKGGHVRRLGVIRVLSVRRERLDEMVGTEYGDAEAVREGYPEHSGEQFAEMFAQRLAVVRECLSDVEVTRIEFEHVDDAAAGDIS